MLKRYARLGVAVPGFVLAGCGDSTAPHTVSPAQLARHIDSLSVAVDTGPNGSVRSSILKDLELAPALGATPVPVQVRTPSGQGVWQGFMWKNLAFAPGTTDSVFVMVAYSDYALDVVIDASEAYTPNGTQQSVMLMAGANIMLAGTGTMAAATTATSSACILATGLKNFVGSFGGDCDLGTFEGSLDFTFFGAPEMLSDYASISIAPQQFNGVVMK